MWVLKDGGLMALIIMVFANRFGTSQDFTPDDPAFRIQPPNGRLIVSIDDIVTLQCLPQPTLPTSISIVWLIEHETGIVYTQLEQEQQGITEQYHAHNNTYCVYIPIKENGLTNNTRVRCRIIYRGSNSAQGMPPPPLVHSTQTTISIQGKLDMVDNLTDELLDPGRSTNISWIAPYTLNITDSEPDITYHLTVTKMDSTGNISQLDDYSAPNISDTNYTLTFLDGVISSCDSLKVIVTPLNGFYRNISGTTSAITVYLHEGVGNFTASDVNSTVIETEPNHLLYTLMLPVNVVICPYYCRITAPNYDEDQTLCLDDNSGLECRNNILVFNVTNDTTPSLFSLKKFYTLSIEVGNSAGRGHLTGNIILSEQNYCTAKIKPTFIVATQHAETATRFGTHLIQEVTLSHEDDTTLQLVIRFAQGARLWGAQVALTPEILNKTTCENYIRNNFPKTSDTITEHVRDIPAGVYDIKVYIVENGGSPDTAVTANQPRKFTFTAGTSSPPTIQSDLVSVRRFPTILMITNTSLPSHQYIGILTDETQSSSIVVQLSFGSPSENITVNNGTAYCLSMFRKLSLTPIINIYTNMTTDDSDNDDPTARIVGGVSVLVFLIIAAMILISLLLRKKFRAWLKKDSYVAPKNPQEVLPLDSFTKNSTPDKEQSWPIQEKQVSV